MQLNPDSEVRGNRARARSFGLLLPNQKRASFPAIILFGLCHGKIPRVLEDGHQHEDESSTPKFRLINPVHFSKIKRVRVRGRIRVRKFQGALRFLAAGGDKSSLPKDRGEQLARSLPWLPSW